jgi:carbamoyl-phosphate synthase large subunit
MDIKKVLIIGSGPIIIGQACEFDYSGTQACKALRQLGYQIVLVNSNPATIMTDPGIADVTYIEPLNVKRLEQIIAKERPDAILPNLGGQSGLNLCSELASAGVLDKYNVKVIGVQVDAIERGEDRVEFKKTMSKLGIEMARSEVAYSVEEALAIADRLGYPVVLRPAYTMGGAGGGTLTMPIDVTFGGTREVGTASVSSDGVITFTPKAAEASAFSYVERKGDEV